jgi:hypothetical protein
MFDEAFRLLDPYTLRARLIPALLAGLPIAISFVAWFPERLTTLGIVFGLVVLLAGTTVLSQVARDCGKKLQPGLFEEWGGLPSVVLLRHDDSRLNPDTKKRYRRQLEKLIDGLILPTDGSEAADPAAADLIYASCSDFLRERTRNAETFGLLLSENINYGTRRNLLGLKPCALVLASIGSTACAGATIYACSRLTDWVLPAICLLVSLLCVLWWCFRITTGWVRITAFAYAERLLAACDQLQPAE